MEDQGPTRVAFQAKAESEINENDGEEKEVGAVSKDKEWKLAHYATEQGQKPEPERSLRKF